MHSLLPVADKLLLVAFAVEAELFNYLAFNSRLWFFEQLFSEITFSQKIPLLTGSERTTV